MGMVLVDLVKGTEDLCVVFLGLDLHIRYGFLSMFSWVFVATRTLLTKTMISI